jgi:hypothetical protein
MENYLSDEKQSQMRNEGVLTRDEVALRVGDILLAENVLTRERRVIPESTNEGRRVLKG